MGRKLFQKYVENRFAAEGYELRSEYMNSNKILEIYCPTCKNIFKKTWDNFKQGQGCPKCGRAAGSKKRKHTFAKIKMDFTNRGFILLSEANEYKTVRTYLKCICVCGRETKKRHIDLAQKRRCRGCASEESSKNQRTSNEVASIIASVEGLTITDFTFKNAKSDLKVECMTCKFNFVTKLNLIKNSHSGCPKCRQSAGERKIRMCLDNIPQITYRIQYRFPNDVANGSPGCINKLNLPFDILVEPLNGHEMLIEFDGEQHFRPIKFYGGLDKFKSTRLCDITKSIYCYSNNIPLLRISYLEYNDIEELVTDFVESNRYRSSSHRLYYSDLQSYNNLIQDIDEASKL